MLFTKWPIDSLNNNIVEMWKVISIKLSFDNWMYESNPQNYDFDYLYFYGDQGFITGLLIYCVTDDIVERLENGLIVNAYMNQM